jgi:hypothetical protein
MEREVTVDCPLDCEYLVEARRHEKVEYLDPEQAPNRDIRVSEKMLEDNEKLLAFLSHAVVEAATETPGAVDFDTREALESLVRTYRSLESGVYYETVPANPLAANLHRQVQGQLEEFRRAERQHSGVTTTRDADVLGCLVFLQRLGLNNNNGRRRGRAFLSVLVDFYGGPPPSGPAAGSSLILP